MRIRYRPGCRAPSSSPGTVSPAGCGAMPADRRRRLGGSAEMQAEELGGDQGQRDTAAWEELTYSPSQEQGGGDRTEQASKAY